jgi:DNA replication protein DnaC
MDDTEMGRPPRHARPPRQSAGGFVGDLMRKGLEASVRVRGRRRCACGARIDVDFSGPEDSLGVRLARGRLERSVCDDCSDREQAEQEAVERQEQMVAMLRRRVEMSRVPTPWRTLTFDRLEPKPGQEEAFALAQRWARGELPGVLLHGETGVGKTLMAAAATVERCAVSPARWLGVAELLLALRMPFDSPEYVRAQRWLDPGTARCALVLDDLDKMRPTEHQLQPLYAAVNAWVEARQPLLVTCNRDLDALADWMGETFGAPIASRLAGYCDVVDVPGEDWRLA